MPMDPHFRERKCIVPFNAFVGIGDRAEGFGPFDPRDAEFSTAKNIEEGRFPGTRAAQKDDPWVQGFRLVSDDRQLTAEFPGKGRDLRAMGRQTGISNTLYGGNNWTKRHFPKKPKAKESKESNSRYFSNLSGVMIYGA